MQKIFTSLAIIMLLTSCHNVPVWRTWMFEGPPPGREYPPLYTEGWVHGCESGAASSANHFYKFRYSFQQDWQLVQNPVYRKGWDDAWKYCTTFLLKHNWDSVGRRII